jgi:hypothetical protein
MKLEKIHMNLKGSGLRHLLLHQSKFLFSIFLSTQTPSIMLKNGCWFSSMIPLIYSEECPDIYSNPGAIKAPESHDRMKDKPTKSKYTTPV